MAIRVNSVCVVDDEEFDRLIAQRAIQRANVVNEAEYFTSADEFGERIASEDDAPDIIFLDINMPRMNAFEFLEEYSHLLCRKDRAPLVAILTTSASPEDRQRALDYDIVKCFFTKPLTPAHIIEATSMAM